MLLSIYNTTNCNHSSNCRFPYMLLYIVSLHHSGRQASHSTLLGKVGSQLGSQATIGNKLKISKIGNINLTSLGDREITIRAGTTTLIV